MIDQHYTPSDLAGYMVEALPSSFSPEFVADFSAGEGSLLSAASGRWPGVQVLANDWCSQAARMIERRNVDWIVSRADFMSSKSVSRSRLAKFKGKVDLILLNPPFSQRGVKPASVDGLNGVTCGLALAFTFRALSFLKSDGFAVAILPDGCLTSVRDKKARDYLEQNYTVRIVRRNADTSFLGVRARTSILLIQNRKPFKAGVRSLGVGDISVNLFRGKFQMHKVDFYASESGLPLVHTTSLKNGVTLVDETLRVDSKHSIVGPCLLFPRVGNVGPGKVSVLEAGRRVVISDCIFAVKCVSDSESLRLRSIIIKDWEAFEAHYSGTGARYTTLKRISYFIDERLSLVRVAPVQGIAV